MTATLNVREFGALGDGHADDTPAIQKAIDAAGETRATVAVPAGTYAASTLRLRPYTALAGEPTWGYRQFGGAVLRLADPRAPCLLDLTGAVGVTISGLNLDGARQEGATHGIMFDKGDYGQEEDACRIERCRIGGFSGDGVHLGRIWCFSVRHSMICFNRGHGISVRGWDGFVLDNWLSGNAGAGYAACEENSSVTMTANRIEWNAGGGILIRGGSHYNVTGNYIDRSGGCGIRLLPRDSTPCRHLAIVGNVIFRSGRPDWRPLADHESSHAWLEGASGLTFTANAMNAGRDDGGKGHWSPRFGIVLKDLSHAIVKDNVLVEGALEKLIVDLHGHGSSLIVADNVGTLLAPPPDDP